MPLIHTCMLRRSVMVIVVTLLCPPLWGESPKLTPKVLTALWQTHVAAQFTGLDLSWDGQTAAFTVAPLDSDGDSHLHVYDLTGRELWTTSRGMKIIGVSLSADGKNTAIGSMDFSIAFFSNAGELLWERKSVGLPYLTPHDKSVGAFNAGITDRSNALLEVFLRNGEKSWSLHRKGRVWRSAVSDQSDFLIGLWNREVLLINRQHRMVWQQRLSKDIMALAISPVDAHYFAVGTGILEQELQLFERSGRLVWRRQLPLGVTELSLARQGEFLLSYGNTIRGQHLALYNRDGKLLWTYHLPEPASESSKAVIVPDSRSIVAGLQRNHQYYLQGFTLTGELLWVAPIPDPLFDFRVSRDGRYVAAATDRTLYFFDTQAVEGAKAELQK